MNSATLNLCLNMYDAGYPNASAVTMTMCSPEEAEEARAEWQGQGRMVNPDWNRARLQRGYDPDPPAPRPRR